ncbi:class II aldolase/adducin family protein [Streptomyces sp. NPDC015139]|uniref:class II aldolase/adducin family protein n=1 Tax=Streptomyces sp. NPDC015139 TaxID=3364942 RepID=UPI0036F9A3EC
MKPLYLREDTERQRERLAATARHLHRSGWMPGTSGSVSLRSGDAVLITAHDLDKGRMDARDTVLIDPSEGLPLLGETEWPCAETPVHLALHGYLPDCETVVHLRAAAVTTPAAFTCGPGGSTPTMLPALPARPDPGRTADEVRAALDRTAAGAPAALLVADAGVFTWGRDLGEALAALDGAVKRSRSPLRPGAAPDPAGWTR